jgi:hypothetical protein
MDHTDESDSTAESRICCPRPRKKQKMVVMRPETLQGMLDTIRDLKAEIAALKS